MQGSAAGQYPGMPPASLKAQKFRALHVPGRPIVLFNIWDAGSAKAVERSGAAAIGTSSWAVAAANGFSDGERMPRALALDNLRSIAGTTDLPVTLDLESGYGDTPEGVGETVRFAIEGGAIGCNLEDSYPEDGKLRVVSDHCARLAHARKDADTIVVDFFINARTDVFFQRPPEQHDDGMVGEALTRARAYADAGADGLFVPGLRDPVLIARLVKGSPLPVNIMMGDTGPSVRALAECGVARVSYGPGPYLFAMKALEEYAKRERLSP